MVTPNRDIAWVVGKGTEHQVLNCGQERSFVLWTSIELSPERPSSFNRTIKDWGHALAILWEHECLNEVALLTKKEWLTHEAASHCTIQHNDHGLNIYH